MGVCVRTSLYLYVRSGEWRCVCLPVCVRKRREMMEDFRRKKNIQRYVVYNAIELLLDFFVIKKKSLFALYWHKIRQNLLTQIDDNTINKHKIF